MRFRVALLQIAPHGNDRDKNLAKGLRYCREAKALGADLALFPELWSVGSAASCPDDEASWRSMALGGQSEFLSAFATHARDLDLNIAVTYLEAHTPKPLNSVSIFDRRGGVALHYSKVCICDFPADGDDEPGCDVHCAPGETFDVCTLAGAEGEVKVGAMICADREFPEPAATLAAKGAELIVIPNACTWDDVRTAGLLTRAVENFVGVAMANYPAPLTNGNSRAYTCAAWHDGKTHAPALVVAGEQEELLLAEFDIDAIRRFRRTESWRLQARRRAARLGSR